MDFADWMICDLRQHGTEVEFRVQPVELGRTKERVHGSGAFTAGVRSDEEEVLPSKSDGPQCSLGGAIIDLEQTVFGVASESTPARERVPDRSGSLAFR